MTRLWLPERLPWWARQGIRAVVALGLGVAIGLSAAQPGVLIAVAAILVALLVVASLRRPDALVFFGFVGITMPNLHLPGSPVPLGETIMLLAAFSALLTLKDGLQPVPLWMKLALGALFALYVVSSVVNGLFEYSAVKRLVHIGVYVLVIIGLIRGLLPRKIALRGLQVGLVISAVVGLVLTPRSSYAGRLTGMFGDPNVAGLLLVVLGAVALTGIKRRRNQVLFASLVGIALIYTFSRTALLAVVIAGLWVWLGRRVRPIPAVGCIVLVAVGIAVLPTSIQQFGPFSDRAGSDQLRDRVASQEFKVVNEKPVLGHGAGSATVMVNYGTTKFFFHNSYLALADEIGFVGLGVGIVMLLGTFLALVSLDTTDRQPLLEGAVIGVAVIAINLGEVLVELAAAVAIGFALAHVVSVLRRKPEVGHLPVAA